MELKFERIETNTAMELWRAKIPGGWLIQGYQEAGQMDQTTGFRNWDSSDNRIALTFVPDINHRWVE